MYNLKFCEEYFESLLEYLEFMQFWQTGIVVCKTGYHSESGMAEFPQKQSIAWVQDRARLGKHSVEKKLWLRRDWKPGMKETMTNQVILPLNTGKVIAECCI